MIIGLLHAAIVVKDMDASLSFYQDLLGGKPFFKKNDDDGNPVLIILQYQNGTCIELFYPRSDRPIEPLPAVNHFCLIAADIRECEKALDDNGIEIISRPVRAADGNMQLWCRDPNGYRVEIMQIMADGVGSKEQLKRRN